MTPLRSGRFLLGVLAMFALLAAACSDDGGSDATVDGSDDADAPDPADGDDTAEDGDDAPDTQGDDTAEDGDDTPSAEPAELNFASARGVTADTIKVGITVPDFDALQAAGLSNYQGDNRIAYQAFIDVINAEGGIHGRMIEPVYADFDLLNPVSQDTACAELTGDEEVFIVLYGLLADSNLCLTELNDTMVMTHAYQNTSARERSGETLWLQLQAADDEQVAILGGVVAEAGLLDGATIGILANGALSGRVAGEVLQQTLTDRGFDATIDITNADSSDEIARDAEIDVIAERLRSNGVDFLFNLLGGGSGTQDLADAGFRPARTAYLVFNIDTEATDKSLLDGGVTVASINDDAVWNDPDFRATCIDPIVEASPDLAEELSAPLPDAEQQAAGERSWLVPIRNACNQTMLLKKLGEIAGPDLSNASLRAALDELGTVEMHGYGQANFTSDGKWDGLDEFYLQEYDASTTSLEIIGDAIIVDR